MTDPTQHGQPGQPGQAGQPSEEELRAHLAQLREADVAEIVVQAVNMFATGAQVKLGRSDARLLIDAIASVADAVDGGVDADLVKQIRDAVGQLQMAQVQAERDEAGGGADPAGQQSPAGAGQAGAGQPGAGPPGAGQPGPAPGQPSPGGQQGGKESMTDRLWIPGREPGPG